MPPPEVARALDVVTRFAAPYPEAAEAVRALRRLVVPPGPLEIACLDQLWIYAAGDPVIEAAIVGLKRAMRLQ